MDGLQDGGEVERGSQKAGGDNMLASKKQCSNNRKANKANKAKPSPSKDPQSIAAKTGKTSRDAGEPAATSYYFRRSGDCGC